ncbi:MAG: hypothetical protein AB7V01_19075 [Vicinamibacterales bacterium]
MRARSRQEQGLRGPVRAVRQRTVSHGWDHREAWREEMCGFGQVGRLTAYAWNSSDQDQPQGHLHATSAKPAEVVPDTRPVSVSEHAGGVTVRVHGTDLEFSGRVSRGVVEQWEDGRINVRLLTERGKYLGRVIVEHDAEGRLTRRCTSGDVLPHVHGSRPPSKRSGRLARAMRRVSIWYDAWAACMVSGTPSHMAMAWLRWGADWHEVRRAYTADGAILEEQTLRLGSPVRRVAYTIADTGELETRSDYEGRDPIPRARETHEYEYDKHGNWTRRFTTRWMRLDKGQAFTGTVHEETKREFEYYKVA